MSRNISNTPYENVLGICRSKIDKLYNGQLDFVLDNTEYYNSILRFIMADYDNENKFSSKFIEDLSKIQFDLENNEVMGIIKIGDATVEICYGGGDWEYPIIFALYYDGTNIRGYVPEKGNLYNTDKKIALGNEEYEYEDDEYDEDDDLNFDSNDIDINLLRKYGKKNGLDLSNIQSYNDLKFSDKLKDHPLIIDAIRKRLTIK